MREDIVISQKAQPRIGFAFHAWRKPAKRWDTAEVYGSGDTAVEALKELLELEEQRGADVT